MFEQISLLSPLLLIFLGHVWVDASQGILPVVLPKLKEVFALDYFQVGMMMTVLNVTSSVIQPLFGYISDHIRTGWFVPAGILWTALAMGLLPEILVDVSGRPHGEGRELAFVDLSRSDDDELLPQELDTAFVLAPAVASAQVGGLPEGHLPRRLQALSPCTGNG